MTTKHMHNTHTQHSVSSRHQLQQISISLLPAVLVSLFHTLCYAAQGRCGTNTFFIFKVYQTEPITTASSVFMLMLLLWFVLHVHNVTKKSQIRFV